MPSLNYPPLALAILGLTLACGDKTNDDSGSSSDGPGTTAATGSTATSTGGPTTGGPATDTGTTTAPGTTTGTASGETSSSGGESSSSGGEACGKMGDSCAGVGVLCCDKLECCSGVPVPPGMEYCSNTCPRSNRRLKTDLADLDPAEVLRKLVALPISSWRYRKDDPVVRHIGPMAQDFHAAFGLWNSDTMIFPLDASGVSMVAIQALHTRLLAAEAENEDLRARLEHLESRLAQP